MDAPEKLYISSKQRPDKEIFYGTCTKVEDDDIEYTHTDAFIKKAERYIRSVADGLDRDDDVEAFISEFRKHMKGE